MASIPENISSVRQQINQASQQYGRAPNSVTLLAVSKTQGPEKLQEAYQAGQREFGENYVQEALEKIQAMALPEIVWHFIGPIQANKTRDIAENFHWVESVDRMKIAQRLSSQRPESLGPLNVCIQVNISAEQSKSGIAIDQAQSLCEQVSQLPNLRLRGLMAIPAPSTEPAVQRKAYEPLRELFERLAPQFAHFDTLSIGMSGDYSAAISQGSTIVRVGSAIFGARAPKSSA